MHAAALGETLSGVRPLSIALVIPYGDAREGYFPDTLLELCTTEARRAGHHATLVRVYYQRDGAKKIGEALARFLDQAGAELVVVERVFDPDPLRRSGRRVLLISTGDADVDQGVDWVLGLAAGITPAGRTRRSPGAGDLVRGFRRVLDALAQDGDLARVPGLTRVKGGHTGPALPLAPLPEPFEPALDAEVISLGAPPAITRRAVFGNSGCPFALDPADNPHYARLDLAPSSGLSRLGCAFCHVGGDYQKRADAEVVADVARQARFFVEHTPVRELTLIDQYPVSYLEALVEALADLPPLRLLFASRVDAFVRARPAIEAAVVAAKRRGHALELYLSGFEALSDRELHRYNKGVSVKEVLGAVHAMRELAAAHPGAFDYARARGHSLVLFNPWTTPEDLLESVAELRAHGLRDLFDELGRNRLRLYADLPIARAAERDGLVLEAWEAGDEGAGREKGYARERPWRFADARSRTAWELARRLRERLGLETELAQLEAAATFAGGHAFDAAVVDRVMTDLDALGLVLDGLAGPSHPRASVGDPTELSGRGVELGGACNNACAHCPNLERWRDDRDLSARVSAARASGLPVIFAGREPTLHSELPALIAQARGDDARRVGLVTNGRRCAYPAYARELARAGLTHASVKLFAPSAAAADAISRDSGGFAQSLTGISELSRLGTELELRVRLDARSLGSLSDFVSLATAIGVRRIRVETTLDALGLGELVRARIAVGQLEAAARAADLGLVASPLEAGARLFDR